MRTVVVVVVVVVDEEQHHKQYSCTSKFSLKTAHPFVRLLLNLLQRVRSLTSGSSPEKLELIVELMGELRRSGLSCVTGELSVA
eukprot:SAG31_NODE_18188_length_644_cov_0.919266_1_plen_84_part_00